MGGAERSFWFLWKGLVENNITGSHVQLIGWDSESLIEKVQFSEPVHSPLKHSKRELMFWSNRAPLSLLLHSVTSSICYSVINNQESLLTWCGCSYLLGSVFTCETQPSISCLTSLLLQVQRMVSPARLTELSSVNKAGFCLLHHWNVTLNPLQRQRETCPSLTLWLIDFLKFPKSCDLILSRHTRL